MVELYQPITLEQLMSNIGGQLSLWLGISILTILQAFFYLGSTAAESASENKQKNKATQVVPGSLALQYG